VGEAALKGDERRAHRRVPARFRVHCRRLGRGGIDEDVEAVDLSMGGIRIAAPGALRTGDVVELTISEGAEPVTFSGLVVASSRGHGATYSHVAFTRLGPNALEHLGHLVDASTGA